MRQRCGLRDASPRSRRANARRGASRRVVVLAGGKAARAGAVDLLMLPPGDDVQVALVVRALVAAYQPNVGELGEVLLDSSRRVFRAQYPQLPGDDRGVVAVPALVVSLGEQAEEGALGGQGDGGQGLGDEGFGLDGADSCQEGASSLGGRRAGYPRLTVGRGGTGVKSGEASGCRRGAR